MCQLFFLYESYQEREYKRHRFLAAVNGIDLDKELDVAPQQTPTAKKQANFLFGDPAEYEKLNNKDRDSLTQKMMSHFKKVTDDLL